MIQATDRNKQGKLAELPWPECLQQAVKTMERGKTFHEIATLLHIGDVTLIKFLNGGYPHHYKARAHIRYMLGITEEQLPDPMPSAIPSGYPNNADRAMIDMLIQTAIQKHGHVEPSCNAEGHEERMQYYISHALES